MSTRTRPDVGGPHADRQERTRGPLRSVELAEAAVLADVTVALCLLGWLFSVGAVLIAFAVVPMAAIAARHRMRAVVAAAIAGTVASVLVAGTGLAVNVGSCAALGMVVGAATRRGWSRRRTVVAGVVLLGVPAAAIAVALLSVLVSLRHLAVLQLTNSWRGTAHFLRDLGFDPAARAGDHAVAWCVRNWQISGSLGLILAAGGATWLAMTIAGPTLRRVGQAVALPPRDAHAGGDQEAPDPVPVDVEQVTYRYPGRAGLALAAVSLRIEPAEFVALVGNNGSGKSTLGRVLAGWPPTDGTVRRPGPAGLGRRHGTALMFQRPETQVLGVTAADDVRWGLPPDQHPDVSGLLSRVGLGGFETRETSTLSGGELQRLALAAALAREPSLLIADEATAMVDPAGRTELVTLLRGLTDAGPAVVLITHRGEEAAQADRVIRLDEGRLVAGPPPRRRPPAGRPPVPATSARPLLSLHDVGHVYAARSPWEQRALAGVHLELREGEGLLVVGRNGSGKSTLAWILAGLLVPTEGAALLDGVPVDAHVGQVGLSFQHARLQLLRDPVLADIEAASGTGRAAALAALRLVGLDPESVGGRRIDQLSGGEQRRVALAGMLAARTPMLVLDEPFAGLDEVGVEDLIGVLNRLRAETRTTLVLVSHDTERLERVVDRQILLAAGRITDAPAATDSSASPAPSIERTIASDPDTPARQRRRIHADVPLLRLVPGDSPVHRLWAGTKLLCLVAIAVTLSVQPSWPAIGITSALVAVAIGAGRIPRGAVPRLPPWFWYGIAVGFVLTASAGGKPNLDLGVVSIGLGALVDWMRAAVLAVVVLAGAAIVAWTTPVGSIAPALRRLGAPLRWVRLPVDEWAISIGLVFRCLPLLIDEVRTLAAVRRMRRAHRHPGAGRRRRRVFIEAQELLTAALTVALRRGGEFAAAIDARGGLGAFSADESRPGPADAVALVLTAAVVATALVLPS